MRKTAIEYLSWANPKSIANSFEQRYYDEHAFLFNIKTSQYNENRSLIDVIKSTIILQGLDTRKKLNQSFFQFPKEELKRKEIQSALLEQLPYFVDGDVKIYIPTYSKEINEIYSTRPYLLKEQAYQDYMKNENIGIINPFLTYGHLLFSSSFCRLVKLDSENEKLKVYYHIDFETLFFIKDDLTLEAELPLFDEKVKREFNLNLFDDLNRIANDYFTYDTERLFKDLKEKKFISFSLYEECMEEEEKYQKRKHKKHAL